MRAGEHLADVPILSVAHRAASDRRDQSGSHDRGLPATARTHDREEARPGLALAQPGNDAPNELAPSEEIGGVRLRERPKTLVRVAIMPRGRPLACGRIAGSPGCGQKFLRRRDVGPGIDALGELGQMKGHGTREELLCDPDQILDVMLRIATLVDPDEEVSEVGVPVPIHEQVGRTDVTVGEALAMCEGERGGDLLYQVDDGSGLQPVASLHQCPKAPTAQVPGHDVRTPRLPPVVVDRDDVRMLEGGDRLCLAFEATDERRVGGEVLVEDLDGDVSSDLRLDRSEHDPGGSLADLLQKPIPSQRFSASVEPGVLL